MATPTIAEMLKYANLQMAAEALYNFRAKRKPDQAPGNLTSDTGHLTLKGSASHSFWSSHATSPTH